MSEKKIPEALYPCHYCREEYSWPAEDLHWSDIDKDWVCGLCWSDRDKGFDEPKGTWLPDEIKAQENKRIAELEQQLAERDAEIQRLREISTAARKVDR